MHVGHRCCSARKNTDSGEVTLQARFGRPSVLYLTMIRRDGALSKQITVMWAAPAALSQATPGRRKWPEMRSRLVVVGERGRFEVGEVDAAVHHRAGLREDSGIWFCAKAQGRAVEEAGELSYGRPAGFDGRW